MSINSTGFIIFVRGCSQKCLKQIFSKTYKLLQSKSGQNVERCDRYYSSYLNKSCVHLCVNIVKARSMGKQNKYLPIMTLEKVGTRFE